MNNINLNYYIGSAINTSKRRDCHFSQLRKQIHANTHLQNAFNLYGQDAFTFEVIEPCEQDKLIEREQYWIDYYRENGETLYNICLIAGNNLGLKFSEEAKRRLSKIRKGRKHSEESKRKMSVAKTGVALSDETKAKISASKKGVPRGPLSEEHKKRIGMKSKGRTTMLGKHHSEETKKKLSMANKGRAITPEAKAKMSLAKKGIPLSEEHKRNALAARKPLSDEMRQRLSECAKGRTHSEEAKRKISESKKGKTGYFKGKHFTEEHKRKIAESNRIAWILRRQKKYEEQLRLAV